MCSKIAGNLKQQDFFKRVIASGRLSHSYIFSGISGIGKRMFACELARSLFCRNGSYFTECSCSSCMQVKAGTYPDLYIYGGNELKVENAARGEELLGGMPKGDLIKYTVIGSIAVLVIMLLLIL